MNKIVNGAVAVEKRWQGKYREDVDCCPVEEPDGEPMGNAFFRTLRKLEG
jgi:hypothetical protein